MMVGYAGAACLAMVFSLLRLAAALVSCRQRGSHEAVARKELAE